MVLETEHKQGGGGGAVGEWENPQADFPLGAESDVGLDPRTPEPKPRRLNDWATHVPQEDIF